MSGIATATLRAIAGQTIAGQTAAEDAAPVAADAPPEIVFLDTNLAADDPAARRLIGAGAEALRLDPENDPLEDIAMGLYGLSGLPRMHLFCGAFADGLRIAELILDESQLLAYADLLGDWGAATAPAPGAPGRVTLHIRGAPPNSSFMAALSGVCGARLELRLSAAQPPRLT